MIIKSMSLSAQKELLASARQKYRDSSWMVKGKILDGFVADRPDRVIVAEQLTKKLSYGES